MGKPPNNWDHILIVLEIDGRVVDSRLANHFNYENLFLFLKAEGQTQQFPWAIFISQYRYHKRVTNTDKPILYENERP